MISAITKALGALTQQDLRTLCEKRWPESQNVEFKSALSAEQGQDPWYKDGKVGEYAKRKLFKEIVALANSSGGRLFLGVDESSEKPPVAENLLPLPQCHDLAESLERSAYSWIEPPLTPMRVRGVPVGDDGSGVVVFDVQSSHNAPHRLMKDLQCYTRRGTESVPMTMYEIQDLTLRLDRRTEEIQRSFEESKTEFRAWADRRRPATRKGVAFRVVAVPTGAPLYIARAFRNPQVILPIRNFKAVLDGNETAKVDLDAPFNAGSERPILRGSRREYENDERGTHAQFVATAGSNLDGKNSGRSLGRTGFTLRGFSGM